MLATPLNIHKDIRIRVGAVGEEKQPLILVDNLLEAPEKLVRFAAESANLVDKQDFYPGVRARVPDAYLNLLQGALGELIYKTFKLDPAQVSGAEAFFSIVGTPPEKLHLQQQIPHIDGSNPNDIAFLHFFCNESFGGTSFYRHKSTGHEYVDHGRYQAYLGTVKEELMATGLPQPAQYINGDTDLFERITSLPAAFNRLIIYRGTSLHSGDIGKDYALDLDPGKGRLTVTSFLYSRAL